MIVGNEGGVSGDGVVVRVGAEAGVGLGRGEIGEKNA
jgi:hypothetical protein